MAKDDEVLVALPFPHGFALQGRDFQMTREQFQVARQEAGLEPQEPEDEGRWGEAAAGFAPPQQQDGWGDWNYEAPPPPQQGQGNFVNRSEYNELVV